MRAKARTATGDLKRWCEDNGQDYYAYRVRVTKSGNSSTSSGGTTKIVFGSSNSTLQNASQTDIIKLPDEVVPHSVGAKNINDDVLDLSTGERFKIVPGSRVTNVEVFAGKGTRTPYRNAQNYAEDLGGNPEDWQHVKGNAILDYYEEERKAEIHWSRCEGIGNVDRFIKRWLDDES